MQLGTYGTFDCPIKRQEEAFSFLKIEFEKIRGTVRRQMNPHDFGEYPSFEIDYPEEIAYFDENDFNFEDVEEVERAEQKEEFHRRANEIYVEYLKKFN